MFLNHMSTTELLQKIDLLPPEERASIGNLVEIVAKRRRSHPAPTVERFSQDVLDRIDERMEKISGNMDFWTARQRSESLETVASRNAPRRRC